jgi:hypothetical protein
MKNEVEKVVKVPQKRKKFLPLVFLVVLVFSMFAVQASAASALTLASVDFSTVVDTVTGVVPVVLPYTITMIAIRKGLGMLFGGLRRA